MPHVPAAVGRARLVAVLGAFALAALLPIPGPALVPVFGPSAAWAQDAATVVFVVRHAERAEDGTNDPPISEAGWERARLLAEMLRDAGVTHIHTSDFKRTRQTGTPLAEATGLELEVYDPRDLTGFAERLREMSGRHVVLGHSNTNPALVEALGGDAGAPIEEMEYDRVYVVTLGSEGVTSVRIRFGALYAG